jgi:hypothetical protein
MSTDRRRDCRAAVRTSALVSSDGPPGPAAVERERADGEVAVRKGYANTLEFLHVPGPAGAGPLDLPTLDCAATRLYRQADSIAWRTIPRPAESPSVVEDLVHSTWCSRPISRRSPSSSGELTGHRVERVRDVVRHATAEHPLQGRLQPSHPVGRRILRIVRERVEHEGGDQLVQLPHPGRPAWLPGSAARGPAAGRARWSPRTAGRRPWLSAPRAWVHGLSPRRSRASPRQQLLSGARC